MLHNCIVSVVFTDISLRCLRCYGVIGLGVAGPVAGYCFVADFPAVAEYYYEQINQSKNCDTFRGLRRLEKGVGGKKGWSRKYKENYSLYQKFIQDGRNLYNSPHVIVPLKTTEVEQINNSTRMISFLSLTK